MGHTPCPSIVTAVLVAVMVWACLRFFMPELPAAFMGVVAALVAIG